MQRSTVPKARWWRLLIVTFLLDSMSYMDRINLGFGFAGMQKDLGFDSTLAGLSGSIFFIGFFLTSIPGGKLAQSWGVKKIVAVSCVTWSIFAISTGLVQNITQLLVVRFLLGIAEGGVWPSLIVLFRNWFPVEERGRALSCLALCVPVGAMMISPISGMILAYSTWRVMFWVEGAIPLVWLLVWLFAVADRPSEARWLSIEERTFLEQSFKKESSDVHTQSSTGLQALLNKNVLVMFLSYLLLQIGLNGIGLWLPTVVASVAGGNPARVGYLTALPYLAAIIGLIINGRHSDFTRERKYHVAIPVITGGVFLLISTLLGKDEAVFSIIALILAVGFFNSFNGVIWSIPSEIVDSRVLGLVAGVINGVGVLGGGFLGPFVVGYLRDRTHSLVTGEIFLVVSAILAGIVITFINTSHKSVQSPSISRGQ